MDKIEKKLSEAGYKITTPRKLVLKELLSTKGPISASDLFKKIKKIDQASVYRVLSVLEDLRLVNIDVTEKEKTYCLSRTPHHHISCRKCGEVKDFACRHSFEEYKNFREIEHQLSLTGICDRCA